MYSYLVVHTVLYCTVLRILVHYALLHFTVGTRTIVCTLEAKHIESWPNTPSAWAGAGEDLIFQWRGLVEYIPCYGAPAVQYTENTY